MLVVCAGSSTRSGSNFGVRLTTNGARDRQTGRRHVQFHGAQVGVIPRHFAVEAAAALDQVTVHQVGVVGVQRRPVRLRLARSDVFFRVQRRRPERPAPLHSRTAPLPTITTRKIIIIITASLY